MVVAPIVLTVLLVWSLLNVSLTLMFSIILLLLYLAIVFSRVSYDGNTIRRVEIPNAPDEVKSFLKTTTNNGDLIYVILLRSFPNNEPLSQTEMTNYAQIKGGIDLTSQTIRDYILRMENGRLISSQERTRYPTEKKEYRLTEPGEWCRTAVRQCFPGRMFMFCLRNGLRLARMSEFPGTVPSQLSEERPAESA